MGMADLSLNSLILFDLLQMPTLTCRICTSLNRTCPTNQMISSEIYGPRDHTLALDGLIESQPSRDLIRAATLWLLAGGISLIELIMAIYKSTGKVTLTILSQMTTPSQKQKDHRVPHFLDGV
ncbi:hypothetical protein CVT25_000622 [Psilocybe cyanescens]|uniref:Uncharacterized protein n=1 Tax=Psilocybe cyanescens TaxID=93625 RepID=A0A409XWB6_PSICY|nr:hypothetical protein CVT25_000622 [Psilocybe cyanescens]